ncbi:hypothetical protein F5Y08DRAFT_201750 [Xylaria arbuscula]|nr:hypothetical protein F5Y08DRAFT_201750 [Xylaria arbuscula]
MTTHHPAMDTYAERQRRVLIWRESVNQARQHEYLVTTQNFIWYHDFGLGPTSPDLVLENLHDMCRQQLTPDATLVGYGMRTESPETTTPWCYCPAMQAQILDFTPDVEGRCATARTISRLWRDGEFRDDVKYVWFFDFVEVHMEPEVEHTEVDVGGLTEVDTEVKVEVEVERDRDQDQDQDQDKKKKRKGKKRRWRRGKGKGKASGERKVEEEKTEEKEEDEICEVKELIKSVVRVCIGSRADVEGWYR